jgi:hypothetical protein
MFHRMASDLRKKHGSWEGQSMRHATLTIVIALLPAMALGQEGPKRVKTEIIRESAPGMSILYAIDGDGTVRIDWNAVETLATSKADRNMLPIAQLMLAIRDRTWKPTR